MSDIKVGLVCPYSLDVAGGVQSHVLDLTKSLNDLGYSAQMIAPGKAKPNYPNFVKTVGKAIPIPYNGSVARLKFGFKVSHKIQKWLTQGNFDILHVHEPNAPSISMLALRLAKIPVVATFHTATTKSRILMAFKGLIKPYLEKIIGKIAVSEYARQWQMEALGANALVIPNGINVDFFKNSDSTINLNALNKKLTSATKYILFIGRYNEPRKGFELLLVAFRQVSKKFPEIKLVVIGAGNPSKVINLSIDIADKVIFLDQVTDPVKAALLRNALLYCAPNLSGESFGIILIEAMAAQTAIVASDLTAFNQVLEAGNSGRLFSVGNENELTKAIIEELVETKVRNQHIVNANLAVKQYDWSLVTQKIITVYETCVPIKKEDIFY